MAEPFRLRITEKYCGCKTYLTRNSKGRISYFSANETLQSLSNLLLNEAAEARFVMEDIEASKAAWALQQILNKKWKNNPSKTPTVEELMV